MVNPAVIFVERPLSQVAAVSIPAHVPPECVVDFDIYNPPGVAQDFYGAWKTIQRPDLPDIVWTPHNGGHWIATRGSDIYRMWGDAAGFSSQVLTVPRELGQMTKFIPLQLDPPEHTAYRAAIAKNFAAKYIMPMETEMRTLAIALIDGFKDRGTCEFVSEFAEVLPINVFLMLVGLPVSDRPMLRELGRHLTRPDGTVGPEELVRRADEYLAPYVAERYANPGDDLFSRIMATPINGQPWSMDAATRMCRNLLFGGLDTVAAMIGFITHHLAHHPELRQQIRDNPAIIPAATDEFLRRCGSVSVGREVMKDVEVAGILLKAGDIIHLPSPLHNLDERSFEAAEEVRLDRGICQHSTMGNGPHRCVGAGLARLEIMTFLREWLARIPDFELVPGAPFSAKAGGVGAITEMHIRWPA